jgi:hypothetical protein
MAELEHYMKRRTGAQGQLIACSQPAWRGGWKISSGDSRIEQKREPAAIL